jgi:hypothetical protein
LISTGHDVPFYDGKTETYPETERTFPGFFRIRGDGGTPYQKRAGIIGRLILRHKL